MTRLPLIGRVDRSGKRSEQKEAWVSREWRRHEFGHKFLRGEAALPMLRDLAADVRDRMLTDAAVLPFLTEPQPQQQQPEQQQQDEAADEKDSELPPTHPFYNTPETPFNWRIYLRARLHIPFTAGSEQVCILQGPMSKVQSFVVVFFLFVAAFWFCFSFFARSTKRTTSCACEGASKQTQSHGSVSLTTAKRFYLTHSQTFGHSSARCSSLSSRVCFWLYLGTATHLCPRGVF